TCMRWPFGWTGRSRTLVAPRSAARPTFRAWSGPLSSTGSSWVSSTTSRPASRVCGHRAARRADLGARPDRLDELRRGEMARLARRAAAAARADRRPAALCRGPRCARRDRHFCPPRHGRFEPGADRAQAELWRAVAARARHDAPGHDSPFGRTARPRPDALHRLFEVRDDAGDALAPRLL